MFCGMSEPLAHTDWTLQSDVCVLQTVLCLRDSATAPCVKGADDFCVVLCS